MAHLEQSTNEGPWNLQQQQWPFSTSWRGTNKAWNVLGFGPGRNLSGIWGVLRDYSAKCLVIEVLIYTTIYNLPCWVPFLILYLLYLLLDAASIWNHKEPKARKSLFGFGQCCSLFLALWGTSQNTVPPHQASFMTFSSNQRIPELYFLISLFLIVHFPFSPSHVTVLAFSCMWYLYSS